MRTVGIDLLAGQSRSGAPNAATLRALAPFVERRDAGDLFVRHYGAFAAACREVDEPGVAVVAVDLRRDRVDGVLRLAARPDRVTAGVIGRHNHAALFLAGAAELALRHLVVLVEPATSWRRGSADVRYRILDLRTGTGFESETGTPLVGVRCEGTAFFRCGSYALLCLALGDPSDWPSSAAAAWGAVPERVLFDERAAFTTAPAPLERAPARARPAPGAPQRTTRVFRLSGPRDLFVPPSTGGALAGRLEVVSAAGTRSFGLGEEALREGVLLGRYDRCAGGDELFASDVSRVHLLLVRIGARLLAVDAASTNGTRLDGEPLVGARAIADGSRLVLAGAVEVTWRAAAR